MIDCFVVISHYTFCPFCRSPPACGPQQYVFLTDWSPAGTLLVTLPYPLAIGDIAGGLTIEDRDNVTTQQRVASQFRPRGADVTNRSIGVETAVPHAASNRFPNESFTIACILHGQRGKCEYLTTIRRRAGPAFRLSSCPFEDVNITDWEVGRKHVADFKFLLSPPATDITKWNVSNSNWPFTWSWGTILVNASYIPATRVVRVQTSLRRNVSDERFGFGVQGILIHLTATDNAQGHSSFVPGSLNAFKSYHSGKVDLYLHIRVQGENILRTEYC